MRGTFEDSFTRPFLKFVIERTNIEGFRVLRDDWKTVDYFSIEAYINIIILSLLCL